MNKPNEKKSDCHDATLINRTSATGDEWQQCSSCNKPAQPAERTQEKHDSLLEACQRGSASAALEVIKIIRERDQARAQVADERAMRVQSLLLLHKAEAQVADLLAACKGLLQAYAPRAEEYAKLQGEELLQSDVQRARAAIAAAERQQS